MLFGELRSRTSFFWLIERLAVWGSLRISSGLLEVASLLWAIKVIIVASVKIGILAKVVMTTVGTIDISGLVVHILVVLLVVIEGAMWATSVILIAATLLQVAVIVMLVASIVITVVVAILKVRIIIWSVELSLLTLSVMVTTTSCIFVVSRSEVTSIIIVVLRLPGSFTLRLVQGRSHHALLRLAT